MKKRILVLFAVIIAAFGLIGLCVGCNGEKMDYSVTVLSPDDAPLSGVTVSWLSGDKVKGSADTDELGNATVSIPAGTYTIGLSGYAEGLSYTEVSVNASMANVRIKLKVQQVNYTVTVLDKSQQAASGVEVQWLDADDNVVGTATTDASGIAACELPYGTYTILLNKLPSGNIPSGEFSVTGASPTITASLIDGVAEKYSVTVKTAGGLLYKKVTVNLYSGGTKLVKSAETDDYGVATFDVEDGVYSARLSTGDMAKLAGYTETRASLTASKRSGEIILTSAVRTDAPTSDTRYVIGDIIHDYTFTMTYQRKDENGALVDKTPWSKSITQLFKDGKEAILINNWGTNCSWCVKEMPAMQRAYDKYGDKIEIIAVSNYNGGDRDSVIEEYYNTNGYTFPMMRDTNSLAIKFALTGWPTTIIIDRYGAIARVESGAVADDEAWERMINKYIGADYVQSFTPGDKESESITTEVAKPDVTVPANHYETVAQTINKTDTFPQGASVVWRGETQNDMAWPFMLKEVDGAQVLYSSNEKKANSMSTIYATVTVEPGNVFTFDYKSQTEDADILSIVWDGKIIKQIYGDSDGWQTCYLYTDLAGGAHTLAMAYIKDGSTNVGFDNVYIKNVRFTKFADMPATGIDMFRAAAYGVPKDGDKLFPYYADVYLDETDGYYHVDTSKLQNKDYAGNDEKPLLLVNLMNATNWMPYSIGQLVYLVSAETGAYIVDCNFDIGEGKKDYRDELIEYMRVATSSDIEDCVPVDKHLHDILVKFMANASGTDSHDKEWLEACYFYSHYGAGDPVGNPIMGLTNATAYEAKLNETNVADITRDVYPLPSVIYKFTPEEDGLYKIESFIPDKDASQYSAQIWLYDDENDADHPLVYDGDARFYRDAKNEQNFTVYYNMKANHVYYMQLAFLVAEKGVYNFTIEKVNKDVIRLLPCSDNEYTYILDEDGKITSDLLLAGAVSYYEDDDGFYRVGNKATASDSDPYIYFDVKYATALTTKPISTLYTEELVNPLNTKEKLGYKTFDFTRMAAFFDNGDNNIVFNEKYDLTVRGAEYKDYTADIKAYVDAAEANDGLVKVDDKLVKILTLFIETRINTTFYEDGNGGYTGEKALENEWLRLCWYYKTYTA
ncbi:MAG: redoxin domain-containing protein [Clostridiales bacterium]|nr:redoxin domain-containing protein [Clostridiales bacterium]